MWAVGAKQITLRTGKGWSANACPASPGFSPMYKEGQRLNTLPAPVSLMCMPYVQAKATAKTPGAPGCLICVPYV